MTAPAGSGAVRTQPRFSHKGVQSVCLRRDTPRISLHVLALIEAVSI